MILRHPEDGAGAGAPPVAETATQISEAVLNDLANDGPPTVDIAGAGKVPQLDLKDVADKQLPQTPPPQPPVNQPQPEPPTQPQTQPSSFWKPFVDKMKEKYPDIEIGDINDANAIEQLAEVFYKNADWSESLNPKTIEFQRLIDAHGGDVNKAMEDLKGANTWRSLSDDDLLTADLMQNHGATEDKAKSIVSKMSEDAKEVEALKLRGRFDRYENDYAAYRTMQLNQQQAQQQQAYQQTWQKEFNETLDNFNKTEQLWGLPVDAKRKQEFPDKFKKWITPGEDGMTPIAKHLADNQNLLKVAYLLEYGDSVAKEALFRAKEGAKTDLINKLDLEPQIQDKNYKPKTQGDIDYDIFTQPDNG